MERWKNTWSLARLAKVPQNTWAVLVWSRQNTQLCFSCWAIWHGYADRPDPDATSGDCPCCKLISITLRSNGSLNDTDWYAILQYEGRGIKSLLKGETAALDERESGRSPLFLEIYLAGDWVHNSPIWLSFESNAALRRRRICSAPTISFDIPSQVDIPLLRSWTDKCESHRYIPGGRAGNNNNDRSQQVHDIFLIDVRQEMLVRCSLLPDESMVPYFTLSYVWGSTEFFKTTKDNIDSLLLAGGLAESEVELPRTFLDAMKLVRLIGGTYLWIDALCIIQDDHMKHAQLHIMDQIYGRAYMTIVSLVGNSAHAGLPGVDANTRVRRSVTCPIDSGTLYVGLPCLERAIRESKHHTRAWTYQETFVSKRCLFVSEGQFFYRCCSRTFHAEGLDRQAEIPSNQELELGLGLMPDWWRSENAFFSAIENYTKRTLSHDEDIMDAFSGALERMKEMGYRPRGDPTMDLTSPNALLWFPVKMNLTRRSNLLDSAATIYPSWSWTGWRGAVTYASLKFGRNASFRTVTLRWSHRYKPAHEDTFHNLEARHDHERKRHDPVDFCVQLICSQLLGLALREPRFEDDASNRYSHVRHLNLYKFRTFLCSMSNFTCSSSITYVHRRATPQIEVMLVGLHNRDGKRCGFLFNPPKLSPTLSSLDNEDQRYFLVALSMKKQHNWLENIPEMEYDTDRSMTAEKKCLCCLNVMLVKKSNEYHGIVERIAVGQMHPPAWAEAVPIVTTITMM